MIRKLQSGEYRLYSRKINPKTGKRRNLGTFKSRAAAEKHDCGLIVMASHGRRGVQALVLGSETQRVLTHTIRPVLVIR